MRLTNDPRRRLGRRHRPGELDQRERVSVRLGEEAFTDGAIEVPDEDRFEQGARVGRAQPAELQLRHAVELLDDLPACEDEPDGIGAETACDERQRSRRLGIEPLCIVDDAQERLRRGDLGHETEGRESDQVAVGSLSRGEPERDAQRIGLRLRQCTDRVRHRPAQLLQSRVRKVDLTLDALSANDLEPGRRSDQLLQQRGLADAWLASYDERRAPTGCDGREQLAEPLELGISAHEQAHTRADRSRCRPMLPARHCPCVVRHVSPQRFQNSHAAEQRARWHQAIAVTRR